MTKQIKPGTLIHGFERLDDVDAAILYFVNGSHFDACIEPNSIGLVLTEPRMLGPFDGEQLFEIEVMINDVRGKLNLHKHELALLDVV